MDLKLHANATTTPKIRAYIQTSRAPVGDLARELGLSETTIRRWRSRTSVNDRSHTPKNLAISLTDLEERIVVGLRTELELSLDDIHEVMRRCCNPDLSRSAIHRCLKRHGIAARRRSATTAGHHPFEDATVGFIHIDLKYLPALDGRKTYVFVAIDRATRFVHVEIVSRRNGKTIARCLERFIEAFPFEVHTILTDNGTEFTDRFGGARWLAERQRPPTGRHPFDRVCRDHGIEHRLIRPHHPQTNGMVERFNRRISEAIAAKPLTENNSGRNAFHNNQERDAFIHGFVERYNKTRLRCLEYKAPAEMIANHAKHNTCASMME